MKKKNIILVILGLIILFGIQKIIAANGLDILNIRLSPTLDIGHFGSYTLEAEISGNILSGTVMLEGINGDGTGCWNYLASGDCIKDDSLTFPLVFSGGKTRTKKGIRPDYIYPEIVFGDNYTIWNNTKSNDTIYLNNYEIMHFKNPFTVEGNMSFFLEFNIEPRSKTNSANLSVYLIEKNKPINFFNNNWLNNTGAELVASFSRTATADHTHTSNSSHYLVTLTTNPDGTIGTKNININDDFWLVLVSNINNSNRGRNLKYLPSSICDNTNGWYTGNPSGRSTSPKAGCPDSHIHLARRDLPIQDGMKATLNIDYMSGGQILQTTGSQNFYFNVLPNLAPNATSFYSLTSGNYSGNINISRYPSNDANNDPILYSLYLLNYTGTEIATIATGINSTGYIFDSSLISDGQYGLRGEACDQELCSTFTLESNFQIDNTSPIISEVTPIETFTNQTTPSYVFYTDEEGKINYSGDCSSTNTTGIIGNNIITLSNLTEGTYSNCKIQTTDKVGNTSDRLNINTFTIYTTNPTANIIYNITGLTNQDVIATITGFNRNITGLNATDHAFTENGSFTFIFKDLANNTGSATATVSWIDKTIPYITLSGTTNLNLYLNTSYEEQGANWIDNFDGTGVISSATSGTLDTSIAGTYILEYGYTDKANNYGMKQRTINVINSTGVIINIIGSNPYYLEYGDSYIEQGATRTDVLDGYGNVTNIISNVNTGNIGSYEVEYTHVNNAGLTGFLSRTVIVQDTTAPTITLNGDSTIYLEYGDSYIEQGATWMDIYDGNGNIVDITGMVNTGNIGTYTITYSKTDHSLNTSNKNRTIIVQDTINPSVILSSTNPNPTNEIIYMTAEFSENITGFSVEDIITSNGSIFNFTKIDADTYTFEVHPTYQGTKTISINHNTYKDLANNHNTNISIFTIEYDTIPPTASDIIYNITEPTTQNVIAYIEGFSETYTGLNATSYTFTDNGEFAFTFEDLAGNTGAVTATVDRIDKTKPTGTIQYSTTTSTNQNVIATLTGASEVIRNINTKSYTFTDNGDFIFTFEDLAGNTGAVTASVTWIDKTNIVDVKTSDEDEIQTTGNVIFIGGTQTGVTFSRAGTIVVNETNGLGKIEINTNGLTIIASGDRNMILLAPTETGILQTEKAEFGEIGIPLETEDNITRKILNTVKAGSTGAQLISTGGDHFKITFNVNDGVIGETLKVYRSDDGYVREQNNPDKTCTLDSNKLCTFFTNHLSYFSTIDEEYSDNNILNNQGGIKLKKDICPNGDFSQSYYDKTCLQEDKEENKKTEFEQAYDFAYKHKITNKKTQEDADMGGEILRIDLAKMLFTYSLDVLGRTLDNTKLCEFNDLEDLSDNSKSYAVNTCQLGLMGQNTNNEFNPYGKITRAEFGTILSRLLRGKKYNKLGSNRYEDHLKILKEKEIMKQINIPTMLELRGYVMLMLMRTKDF